MRLEVPPTCAFLGARLLPAFRGEIAGSVVGIRTRTLFAGLAAQQRAGERTRASGQKETDPANLTGWWGGGRPRLGHKL